MNALDTALSYINRGWAPVPVPYRMKKPNLDGWQNLRITADEAPRYFNGAPLNVGVILGPPSNGLVDIDLDTIEAIGVAPYLLPKTGAVFGRASRRASHWLYAAPGLAESLGKAKLEFRDPLLGPDAKPLLELRVGGSGAQTVFPGSVHESGEHIAWEERGEPSTVAGDDLQRLAARAGAAALLARYWPPEGGRHQAALALGGMLAHGGWSAAQSKLFVEAVARTAKDEQWRSRVKDADDSVDAFLAGGKVQGLPSLGKVIDTRVVDQAAEWLGLVKKDAFGLSRRSSGERTSGDTNRSNDIVTEDNAAERFADLYRDRLRYCHDTAAWFEWTGTVWRENKTGLAFQWARELARQLSESEAAKVRYLTSKTSFAAGVERFARSDPAFAVTVDAWDRDPFHRRNLAALAPVISRNCGPEVRVLDDDHWERVMRKTFLVAAALAALAAFPQPSLAQNPASGALGGAAAGAAVGGAAGGPVGAAVGAGAGAGAATGAAAGATGARVGPATRREQVITEERRPVGATEVRRTTRVKKQVR